MVGVQFIVLFGCTVFGVYLPSAYAPHTVIWFTYLEMVTSVDIAILAQFMQIFDIQGGIYYFPLHAAAHFN